MKTRYLFTLFCILLGLQNGISQSQLLDFSQPISFQLGLSDKDIDTHKMELFDIEAEKERVKNTSIFAKGFYLNLTTSNSGTNLCLLYTSPSPRDA